MKVLHAVPYFPPERPGGVGEFAARLHRALLAAGHESRVLTRGRPRNAAGAEHGVERIAATAAGWFAALARQGPRAAGFDVVHVHAGEALPLLLALRRAQRRPRVVASWHVCYAGMAAALAPYSLEGQRFGGGARAALARGLLAAGHRVVDRLALPLVDAVVPITRGCAVELLGARRGAAATVIGHGLPPLEESDDAPRPTRVALLYVGSGGHRKRVHALPFVLAHVRSACPDARLRIVGLSAEREPKLARAFAARGLADAVDWVGRLPAAELAAWYRAADVLVLPSAYEGLPLVLVEAMQCGLPVVATRVGGHAEAIEDGRSGFLVPVDDPAALAARCVALLRDEALRRRVGAAAASVAAERFGAEHQLREFLGLYTLLCEA